MTGANAELARLEALAEAACEAMYEARPPAVKDFCDDAMRYFGEAIVAAERGNSTADVERLIRRRGHIWQVYTHQFRGIG